MYLRPKVYCETCNEKTEFKLESSIKTIQHNDISFSFLETRAFCTQCNRPVYVPEVNDKNVRERHKAYYDQLYSEDKANGIA